MVYPGTKLSESHYTKDTQGIRTAIEFSDDGTIVKIGTDNTIEGSLSSDVDGMRLYELKMFAGGRLVVWEVDTCYEAELTIYGSGVPIISSVRGKLVKKELSNN